MRQRNVKNKKEIIENSKCFIVKPSEFKGNWNEVFKNNNQIHIEIGMGKGQFIIENAKRYKDINFIGIEKFDSILALALKKVPENLENLKMIANYFNVQLTDLIDENIDNIEIKTKEVNSINKLNKGSNIVLMVSVIL